MATIRIDRDSNFPFTALQGGHTYILDQHTTLNVDGNAFIIPVNAINTKLQIEGQLYSPATAAAVVSLAGNVDIDVARFGVSWGSNGVYMLGDRTDLTNHGLINGSAYNGVLVSSRNSTIYNDGDITGLQYGVLLGEQESKESFTLTNDGLIKGGVGISTSAANGVMMFGEDSRIVGDTAGIRAFSYAGESTTVTNHGYIGSAQGEAYHGWAGVDTFTNHGMVRGTIHLDAGNDVFIDAGGRLTGVALGGYGDDNFTVMSKKTTLLELGGQGNDTVRSSVTYSLQGMGEIETLILTGRNNISAHGGMSDNTLIGNRGNNFLDGSGGIDVLTGGAGRDNFMFESDLQVDYITDFANNQDKIWISGFTDYDSFDDLVMTQVGDNVEIEFVDGEFTEHIVVEGTRLRALDESDFVFN